MDICLGEKMMRKRKPLTPLKSLQTLTNVGAITAKKLVQIGIMSREEFLARNPYDVFLELKKKVDPTLCRCALACIVGAAFNKPWNEIRLLAVHEFEKQYPKYAWDAKKC